ncbi:unnamed protein product [Linum tenue]|uniref:Ppx/GppA phosphatase N-terminal domain-containing protein n=1 Tax=Linum tenue TaxID=586396 RepID=A0AAV0H939_9ROSI|nr:unnamed protein product [Linum tenue]
MRHSTSRVSALGCHFHFAYFYRRFAFCFTVPFGFRQVLLLPDHLFAVIVMCTNSMKMIIVDSIRRRADSSPSIATLIASALAVTPPPHQSPPRGNFLRRDHPSSPLPPPGANSPKSSRPLNATSTNSLHCHFRCPGGRHRSRAHRNRRHRAQRFRSLRRRGGEIRILQSDSFFPVREKRALLVDIGGGSTEFAIAEGGIVDFATSLKLGFNNNKKRVRNGARCAAIAKEGNHFKGFSAEEIKLIAFLARHYRKKFP